MFIYFLYTKATSLLLLLLNLEKLSVCQGATIRRDEETGEICIARVIHGGLADRSGEMKIYSVGVLKIVA